MPKLKQVDGDTTDSNLIQVVHCKRFKGDTFVYIGRPSVFGNPYQIGVDGSRAEVIAKYEVHLRKEMKKPRSLRRIAIVELARQYRDGQEINLACWCAPKRCHGDVIKAIILELCS